MDKTKLFFLLSFVNCVYLQGTGSGTNGNLRLCVVEGRGSYKTAPKHCPILDEEKSGVECVLGTDRLDCLRRIGKGTVDFGVFSPEDLVAAQWADIDVLVTHEMRQRSRPFERSIVAVVNRRILPDTTTSVQQVLYNSTLCHPGVAVDDIRPLSDTLSEYLESLLTAKSCDPSLSLAENRIKTLAGFFGAACKAGPWVQDKIRDAELKRRYPSLCAACGSPQCAAGDRYWGDVGALTCLMEAAGDVTWAVLDDVQSYFSGDLGALTCIMEAAGDVTWAVLDDMQSYFSLASSSNSFADNFAFLCRDGSWQPLGHNADPCVWLNRPWSVIVAKRKASLAITTLLSSLTSPATAVDGHWRGALTALLDSRTALPDALQPPRALPDLLATARGFREAYSQQGCTPSRHITVCTTSLLEKNKCEWLSEAGAVYGIAPPLQCNYRLSTLECMEAVRMGDSDVVVTSSDLLVRGMRDFDLTPLLHEITPIVQKTSNVIAFVRESDSITKMADLRGKRASFPRFDGLAWHSVLRSLSEKESRTCSGIVDDYFEDICAPGVEAYNVSTAVKEKLTKNCYRNGDVVVDGEVQALRAVVEGKSDVAFISMNTYNMYQANHIQEPWTNKEIKLKQICPDDNQKYCFISWSSIGQILARKNLTPMRRQEIINVFTSLDQLFGKHYPFHTAMFSMYGPFNHELDVLFHNNTRKLATEDIFTTHPFDKIPKNFERNVFNRVMDSCQLSVNSGANAAATFLTVAVALVFSVMFVISS